MLVVVSRPVAYVCGEIRRETLLAVPLHQIDDVIAHEGGEPADGVERALSVAEVRRRGVHDLVRVRISSRAARALSQEADAPADEARVGELDDRAVGDSARERECFGPVTGDPHRQAVLLGPVETELRPFVRDLAALAELADHLCRLFEACERRRCLSEHAPGGVAAPDAEIHAALGQQLQHGEGACGHRWLARRGICDAGPEPHALGVLRHEREEDVRLLPEDVAVEDPAVREATLLRQPREAYRAFERDIRLQREPELHESRESIEYESVVPLSRYASAHRDRGTTDDTRDGQAVASLDCESVSLFGRPATCPVAPRARIRSCRVARCGVEKEGPACAPSASTSTAASPRSRSSKGRRSASCASRPSRRRCGTSPAHSARTTRSCSRPPPTPGRSPTCWPSAPVASSSPTRCGPRRSRTPRSRPTRSTPAPSLSSSPPTSSRRSGCPTPRRACCVGVSRGTAPSCSSAPVCVTRSMPRSSAPW